MKHFIAFLICFNIFLGIANADSILVVTENFEPYNYQKDGKIAGIATQVVRETLKKANLDYEIKIFPWSRAYKMALNKANVLIFSIGRNEKRENSFKWIGPIAPPVRSALFKLKIRSDIQVNSLEDAKHYKIGVMANGWEYHYLIKHGFLEYKNLEPITDYTVDINKLLFKRTDLLSMSEWNLKKRIKDMGHSHEDIERLLILREVDMYMAFGQKTSDSIVEKTTAAFNELKQEGYLDKIFVQYEE